MQDPKHLWMQMEAASAEEECRALCAAYAKCILQRRDARRIRFIGAPLVRQAAENHLPPRSFTAFQMRVRACERQNI